MPAIQMTRTHRILVGIVTAGAVVIAAIGFAGSYAAVRDLAIRKDFGWFANVFPIGIDAGIVVLLALDLLLTWMRIPFPLLRQTAWLLTAATIAFNGAAAWPDPLGVGMHGIIPILFVVSVEAARHAVGRIADITADQHMESVRLTRWLLSPVATFRLWRRMKLWELRSYQQVIKLEQDRLVYQTRLHARYGRGWKRKAPVEALMPLRLAKYGVPLTETAPAGLAAAGIEPVPAAQPRRQLPPAAEEFAPQTEPAPQAEWEPASEPQPEREEPEHSREPAPDRPAFATGHTNGYPAPVPRPRPAVRPQPEPGPDADEAPEREPTPEEMTRTEIYSKAFRSCVKQFGDFPNARQFGLMLADRYGIESPNGGPLAESTLRPVIRELRRNAERDAQHVP